MAGVSATEAARARRVERAQQKTANVEWYIENVVELLDMTMRQRMRVAAQYLQSKIVVNISRPVTKSKSKITGRIVVSNRSTFGEFPKADTTLLMKSIFNDVKTSPGQVNGYVGTSLDYGVILELSSKLNRSFMVRTLNEELDTLRSIFATPIKG